MLLLTELGDFWGIHLGGGSRGISRHQVVMLSYNVANINTIYFSGGLGCYGAIDELRI